MPPTCRQAPCSASWDSNHGQQWLNLQQAVQGTPVRYAGSGPYKDSRVLRCTPLAATDNCLVIFKKDSQHRWRWRLPTWSMPTVSAPIYANPFFFLAMERAAPLTYSRRRRGAAALHIGVLAVGTKADVRR